jgi:hypothetical protein
MSGARVGIRRELQQMAHPGNVMVYRVHVGNMIYGPVKPSELRRIPGFTLQTLITPYGVEEWQPAYKIVNLQKYFNYSSENSFTKHRSARTIKEKLSDTPEIKNTQPKTDFPVRHARQSKPFPTSLLVVILLGGLSGAGTWRVLKPSEKKMIAHQWVELSQTLQKKASSAIESALSIIEP